MFTQSILYSELNPMKTFLYYLLMSFIFLIGIYSEGILFLFERNGTDMSVYARYKYMVLNSIYFLSSLILNLFLLRRSEKKERDFKIVGTLYGLTSLFYDSWIISTIGGLLLIIVILDLYFSIFPDRQLNLFNKNK